MANNWWDYGVTQGFHWTPQTPKAHSGIDLGMPLGTPLTAILPGTIISAAMVPWGGQVNIQSEWAGIGPIVISYLHASKLLCSAGQRVQPGQIVALSGQPPSPQYGSGPHCHFEVSKGSQPPYMGHQGPCNPIDGGFLLAYAAHTNGGRAAMGIPTGWTDDGHTLHAPNGVPVVLGFRDHILQHDWDAGNWPLAAEYHAEHADPRDASSPDGQRQDCTLSTLVWTQAGGVQVVTVYASYAALRGTADTQAATIAQLEAKLANQSDPGYTAYKNLAAAIDAALTTLRS